MSPAALLRNVLRILVPLSVVSTLYLYLYPVFLGCAFPLSGGQQSASAAFRSTVRQHVGSSSGGSGIAPFRLLALGDPQIEGDTSIPNYYRESWFPHMDSLVEHVTFKSHHASLRERTRCSLHDLVDFWFEDVPDAFESIRKQIDLFGNDFYLAHIYRTLRWWTKPSHVTVLGDLLGSQWISDEEFERRSWRFWNRSFRGAERVPGDVASLPAEEYDLAGFLGSKVEGNNGTIWRRRVINVAGNHDVGYAGDMTVERLGRFERVFGKAAYELRFELPITNQTINKTLHNVDNNAESVLLAPELRIVVVNNMNLDTPALVSELQDQTYSFVNDVINTATAVEFKGHFTVVLTHIPLYKPEGVCVDAPFFDFHPSEEGGGLREQNQLSADASKGFLEGIFGLHGDANAPGNGRGRPGVILNGHDHEGCDTYHFINQTDGENPEVRRWEAIHWQNAMRGQVAGRPGHPGLREITVRSMMGGFGGYAGLFSAWFDEEKWEWNFDFEYCALGRQYWWWAVHVTDLIAIVVALVYEGLMIAAASGIDVEKWPNYVNRAFKPGTGSKLVDRSTDTKRKHDPLQNGNGDPKKG